MKITCLLMFCLLALAAPAQTNHPPAACRYPLRAFGHQAANLTPLFQWWQHQPVEVDTNAPDLAAERPMSAWQRVTGTKVGEIGASWVVAAAIYTSPSEHTNARIILNHPPVEEVQLYANLKAQLANVEQQIGQARQSYNADTNAEDKAEHRVSTYRRSVNKDAAVGANRNEHVAEQKHNAAARELQQLDQLEAARTQIQQLLKSIPTRNGEYLLDWFALRLGPNQQGPYKGVLIYDLGQVMGNP